MPSDEIGTAETIELLGDPIARADDLIELRTRWAVEQGRVANADDPFDSDFRAWLERESLGRRFWIASVNAAPVGMVNLLMFERMPTVGKPAGGWGYLCNMYVDLAHRNAGVGARLAAAVLHHADAAGLERVVLSPSERSRPFYASLGFAPASNLLLRPRTTPLT